MRNVVIVDGDLEVKITSYSVNMLEGLPVKSINDDTIAQAVNEARWMVNCPAVHLIEPVITPIPFEGEYRFGTPERLPYVTCIATLHYFSTFRDPSKHGADLMVVWFQDDFAFPIDAEILEKFKAIPFREICWEYGY